MLHVLMRYDVKPNGNTTVHVTLTLIYVHVDPPPILWSLLIKCMDHSILLYFIFKPSHSCHVQVPPGASTE